MQALYSYVAFQFDHFFKGQNHSSNGREARLLQHVETAATRGDAQAVLEAMDACAASEFYMHVGKAKGDILLRELHKLPSPPRAVLELGTYCGYSTVLLASNLRDAAAKVVTVDVAAANVAVARRVIAHAGLSDRVVHVVKPAGVEQALEELRAALGALGADHFDLLFVDHDKRVYLSDLHLLLQHGLLREGSVVVADNLRVPGAPDYVAWMQGSPDFAYTPHSSVLSGGPARGREDVVGVSVYLPARGQGAVAAAAAAAGSASA